MYIKVLIHGKKELVTYTARRSKLFEKSIFYSSSKIINTLKKMYNIKTIIEEDMKFIY